MIELDTIYNEDCIEGMKRIGDASVDCIICDLPYGNTLAGDIITIDVNGFKKLKKKQDVFEIYFRK